MKPERLYNVLLGAQISEKSSALADSANQRVFKVAKDATRDEIREAVQTLYEVTVEGVTTLNVRGKVKGGRAGRSKGGKRPDWKKAYVRLAASQDIDFG